MLGELPSDFLRIQLVETQIYDPFLDEQENHPNPNFLGHFTLTIAEVMDLFLSIRSFCFALGETGEEFRAIRASTNGSIRSFSCRSCCTSNTDSSRRWKESSMEDLLSNVRKTPID